MNKLLTYLFLLTKCLLIMGKLSAQSISPRPALQKHNELTSYQLSAAQIQAYHKRAKQKLGDMVDYMNIVLHSKQASEQKLALKQLQKLFHNPPTWTLSQKKLQAYLAMNPTKLRVHNVQITQQLKETNAGQYQGKLTYQLASKKETLNFTVRKNLKKFGSRTVVVWKLLF